MSLLSLLLERDPAKARSHLSFHALYTGSTDDTQTALGLDSSSAEWSGSLCVFILSLSFL